MKKLALLFALLVTSLGYSQQHEDQFHDMVHAEMKAGSRTMNFVANTNTQNYDITYHKLEFTVDPAVKNIIGKVTTTYTALTNMTTVTFDFSKITDPSDPDFASRITVSSVKKNGVDLVFNHSDTQELIITLPSTQTAGTSATIEIAYSGTPITSGFQSFIINEHNGEPALSTLSEPYGARDWWPCKQDLNDKVDNGIDVYITAPSQYTSVANGIEPEAPVVVGANKTTHFHHSYPIPAYLVAIAVTNYQVYNQQGGLGTPESPFFPIINYIFPETEASMIPSLAITPTIINFYETKFGAYPFRNEKYGHCEFDWGGGMEHTTVSFMTARNGTFDEHLISHEMGHQWFGDKVTCGTWKDIWLNEGITEYLSGLVVEHLDGAASFVNWKDNKINSITSQPGGNLYLTDAQITDISRIFSGRITYNKGSMVANMIRFKMGDINYFQAMRNYLNDPALAYGYAVTPQLKAHLETVSGMDFTEFFNDWVYNEGFPTYTINAQTLGGNQTRITINQTTSHPSVSFFEMPVPIRLLGSGGQTQDVVLNNTTNGQQFTVTTPFAVTGVEFDPDRNIISNNNTATLGNASFELEQIISLYPNPSNDKVTIQLPTSIQLEKAEIYNTLGQLVATETNTNFGVSHLSDGVHVVKITTSEGVTHKNFIKK